MRKYFEKQLKNHHPVTENALITLIKSRNGEKVLYPNGEEVKIGDSLLYAFKCFEKTEDGHSFKIVYIKEEELDDENRWFKIYPHYDWKSSIPSIMSKDFIL